MCLASCQRLLADRQQGLSEAFGGRARAGVTAAASGQPELSSSPRFLGPEGCPPAPTCLKPVCGGGEDAFVLDPQGRAAAEPLTPLHRAVCPGPAPSPAAPTSL